jgi:Escherichia/Staphylococcus phage prohead protease
MNKQKELRYLPTRELRVATNDDGTRTLSGYAAVFNSPSVDLGGFTEILAPGCFAVSLVQNPDVLMLRDHDSSMLLGRTKNGTLKLEEDNVGLHFECKLPATTVASDLIVSIERGDLDGCSFGFFCIRDEWVSSSDGKVVRNVIEAELYEISAVSFPAYPGTSVSVRTAPKEIRSRLQAEKRDLGCDCECGPCLEGDCSDCNDPDCDMEECSCSMRAQRSDWKTRAQIRLGILERSSK